MAKAKVKVRVLEDVTATGISLVKRGANRVPFRIVKNEKTEDRTMGLDIGNLFLKKRDNTPVIVGVALAKGEYPESLLASLKDCGIDGTFDQSQDGTTLVKSDAYVEDQNVTGIKLSNGVVALVTNLEKGLDRSMQTSFANSVVVNSVMPSIRVATETFSEMIWDMTYESMSKAETTEAVGNMLDDFKTYVMGTLNAVPESLYKMEKLDIVPVTKSEDDTSESGTEDSSAEADASADASADADAATGDTEDSADSGADSADATDAGDAAGDGDTDTAADADTGDTEVKKAEDTAAITALTSQVELLVKGVGKLSELPEVVAALEKRIKKTEDVTDKVALSVHGTTISTTDEDSNQASEVVKSETTPMFEKALAFEGFEQA